MGSCGSKQCPFSADTRVVFLKLLPKLLLNVSYSPVVFAETQSVCCLLILHKWNFGHQQIGCCDSSYRLGRNNCISATDLFTATSFHKTWFLQACLFNEQFSKISNWSFSVLNKNDSVGQGFGLSIYETCTHKKKYRNPFVVNAICFVIVSCSWI